MEFKTRALYRPLGCFALFLPLLAAAALEYGIMPLDNGRLAQWQTGLAAMPVYQVPAGYANAPGSVIDLAYGDGHALSMETGGSHTMAFVGYNDLDPDPAKHYWIVLNSWGTAEGHRPNAVFRMAMNTKYDASVTNMSGHYPMFHWDLLDTACSDSPHDSAGRRGDAARALRNQPLLAG